MTKFKNHTEIHTADDFKWYAENILEELSQDMLTDSRYSFEISEKDEEYWWAIENWCTHAYTVKGANLLERTRDRFYELMQKSFPDEELDDINIPFVEE